MTSDGLKGRGTMNDYLLGGVGVALLVLLLIARWLRQRARRPVSRGRRTDRGSADGDVPLSRGGAGPDTVSGIHELPAVRSRSTDDLRLRAEQEAAEQAARAEADREAAEWEAQLLAQQLAQEARHSSPTVAEQGLSVPVADVVPPQAVAPGAESVPEVDEQAVLEALAREAAEWEERLAAQQLAQAERDAAEAAAQAQRAAEEQVARERAEQERAEQARAEQARADQLAAQQRDAERLALAAQEAAAAAAPTIAPAHDAPALPFTLEFEEVVPATVAVPDLAAAPVAEAMLTVRPPPRTPEQCLVMVADDSKVVRVKTSRLLAKHAYRVSLAEDGLDAVRQMAADQPDVLITDVEMPGMDGFELTRQVRADPRTAHIPIVMITADDVKHRADAMAAGVSVLLSKPYPEDELMSYLQSTLAGPASVH